MRPLQMEFWVTQLFNGVSYGALPFLLGGGLTLIFGMMRIVNMTHGSHYLLGCYVAVTVLTRTGSYLLAMLVAIEHDMDVAFQLTDRITVLHYGRVVADGMRDEVTANPLVQEIYLGAS